MYHVVLHARSNYVFLARCNMVHDMGSLLYLTVKRCLKDKNIGTTLKKYNELDGRNITLERAIKDLLI